MLLSRMLRRLRDAWKERACSSCISPEPLDHPSLSAMSLRELADLPIEPPAAVAHGCAARKTG